MLVAQARTRTPHGIGHGAYGFVLADDSLVQLLLHSQELLFLALEHTVDGDAGPARHHLGDVVGCDGLGDDGVFDGGLLGAKFREPLLGGGKFAVADFSHAAVVAGAFGNGRIALIIFDLRAQVVKLRHDAFLLVPALLERRFLLFGLGEFGVDLLTLERRAFALDGLLLDLQLTYAGVQVVDGFGHRIHLQTQLAGRFVHQVDGLVGEETVVDVTMAEVHRSYEGVVFDAHTVVRLVLLFEATENGDALGGRGFVHHYLLESALKGLVLLEVFLVLVEGCGAYGAELTPCKGRL